MRKMQINKKIAAVLIMLSQFVHINTVCADANAHFDAEFNKGINKEISYQSNPDAIKSDANVMIATDKTAKEIKEGIGSHPIFNIDPASPQMTNIQNRADSVYDVITGQFGDCTKQTSCTTTYDTKTCDESPKSSMQHCQKILNIDFISKLVDTHYPLTLHLSTSDHNYAGVDVNVVDGHLNFVGPHDARFTLDGRLPSDLDCHGLSGKIIKNNSLHAL